MKTVVIFISGIIAYVISIFIWGIYKEKRTKAKKKDDQDIYPFIHNDELKD